MQDWALQYLACPRTGDSLKLRGERVERGDIVAGELVSEDGDHCYPIVDGIPRFVSGSTYSDSFGFQWNKYWQLRSDKYNGTTLIRDTILRRTRWEEDSLDGKIVLECGCGCANDTEVLLNLGAKRILSFDLSNSVNSARNNLADAQVTFIQADIFELPFKNRAFDVIFCHRMIQHTPDPERAFHSIANQVCPGGEVLLHSYDKHPLSMLHWKYLLRPLTKRLPATVLFRILNFVGPALYSIQSPFMRIKFIRFAISRLIPFYNYSHIYRAAGANLSKRELFEVSLLDTFDALAPQYDLPNTADTILGWFRDAGLESVQVTQRNPVFVKARAPRS